MSNKKFVVTKYFDSYPTSPYCVCDTIEEARKKRDEANNKYRSAITDFHILVYGMKKNLMLNLIEQSND